MHNITVVGKMEHQHLHQKSPNARVAYENITYDAKATKPQLDNIHLTKQNKPDPVYKTDELLHERRHGLIVLRLPSYHCDWNPIELIQGDLKGPPAQENN